MTPDEQEAESRKYVAPLFLVLSSGHVALFDAKRKLIKIVGALDGIDYWMRYVQHLVDEAHAAALIAERAPKPKPSTATLDAIIAGIKL